MKKLILLVSLLSSFYALADGTCTIVKKVAYDSGQINDTDVVSDSTYYADNKEECFEMAKEHRKDLVHKKTYRRANGLFGPISVFQGYYYVEWTYSRLDFDLGLFDSKGRIQSDDDGYGNNSVLADDNKILVK